MGFGDLIGAAIKSHFPGASDDLTLLESLGANQDMWANILSGQDVLGPRDDNKGWANAVGGVLGFGSFLAYELGIGSPVTQEVHGALAEEQVEQFGAVYNEAFKNAISQELRNLLYIIGWFVTTAPATLIFPFLTSLNGQLQALDPLLRPPLNGFRLKFFNPIGAPKILTSEAVTYDPITFGTGASPAVKAYNPIDGTFNSLNITIQPYNPIIP